MAVNTESLHSSAAEVDVGWHARLACKGVGFACNHWRSHQGCQRWGAEHARMLAGVAAAQQMMISPEDLQQLLQASMQPSLDWSANAELLHQLQQVRTGPYYSLPCPVCNP